MSAFFLTGTDTEIGKTFSACALLHAWRNQGFSAVAYKPVAAGAELIGGHWSNEDARRLLAASSPGFVLEEINPLCLRAAIAPHLAAAEEGRELALNDMLAGFHSLQARAQRVLVEGVGGFRVPLGRDFDSADLAVALGLPVILVIGLRLGCLNHALLTTEAIQARGLRLAGWIGNTLDPTMNRLDANISTLHEHLRAPCLGILPHAADGEAGSVAQHLLPPA
ncbi:dethiobiotin synthase [Uliginosibacterium aquaticum]|uniref:ATP-dependent dethiobiotin synthetase BioD n=1 Tax=Uliginosibacterium aquaticum TaxID=2731212 RepID=A0ABX2IIY9_9RHOO|nr:dethiobiotin synthase [Uliginosibacterium aquaticum]NSL56791.1 dethiobiotin synthase [Uliginosibacterium aquaticum]